MVSDHIWANLLGDVWWRSVNLWAGFSLGGPSGLLREGKPCLAISGGYYTVMVNRKPARVHRIIWELKNGAIPDGLFVDHINGDRLDNDFSNLRLVTQWQNNMNTSRKSYSYKHGRKWRPEVTYDYKKYRGPSFLDRDDAEEFGELLSFTLKGEYHRG